MSPQGRSPFVFDWLFEHAASRPEAAAVGTPEGGWVSYGDLADRVRGFAAALGARGVGPGSFVILALPNTPAAVVAALATQALGGTAVEVNRELGLEALSAICTQTGARHAVVAGRDVRTWGDLARRHRLVQLWVVQPGAISAKQAAALEGAPAEQLSEQGVQAGAATAGGPWFRGSADAPAHLVYTSGSTGTPRAIVQTHRNIAANTAAIVEYLGLTADDRVMAILPLFYCYGKSLLQTHLWAGGSVFFDGRFLYPRVVLEAIGAEGCTGFSGVPLTFELLRRQLAVREVAMPRLRYVTQAGGAMHPETIAWAREAFAPARLFVMYGQTEATARLSYLPPERAEDKRGSIGRGLSNVALRVVDDAGRELPPGETGQLIARGESITPGYFQDPEETAAVFKDGWLWTGDLGHRDADGFVFLTGRAKEILKIGGHRVNALEIEQALATHPEVVETAVVGVPDDVQGEVPIAFVVVKPGAAPEVGALLRHARQALAPYKVPKDVVFVSKLPRTGSGKVARAELRKGIPK